VLQLNGSNGGIILLKLRQIALGITLATTFLLGNSLTPAIADDAVWGYVDRLGKLIIPAQYQDAWTFSDGLAAVEKDGNWGFIDRFGKVVIKPQFDRADSFAEGLAAVRVDKKWGYIDKSGNMVIEPKFDGNWAFGEGLAPVMLNQSNK